MYENESADIVISVAIAKMDGMRPTRANEKERWRIYEDLKQRLQVRCAWGREYEYYINRLVKVLHL